MVRQIVGKTSKSLVSTTNSPQTLKAPQFSPTFRGRKSSVILDNDGSSNVIINPNLLKMHKNAPPNVRMDSSGQKSMTDQEFAWWSDPFLRMLSSPLRICTLTKRYAPTDHLIRMTAALFAQPGEPITSSTPAYIMPSNLHHPRYVPHPRGQGAYIPCSKKAVPLLTGKGRHRGLFPGAQVHDLLEEQITSGLQARCVEEAELLATSLRTTARYKPGEPVSFTVRRLTEEEYETVQKLSKIHDSDVIAVVVAPKPEEGRETALETLPKSQLLFRGTEVAPSSKSTPPVPRIPIYWIPYLFYNSGLRTAFRKALDSALDSERTAVRTARRSHSTTQDLKSGVPYKPKSKDAYALCSSRRVDSVPLAIALWRLRLWEGVDDC